GYGNWETMTGTRRPALLSLSDAEMTIQYSAELRGLAQYYVLATNFATLSKRRYLWITSYLHTLANKYKSSTQKVATMLNRGSYMAVRAKDKTGKTREIKLFQLKNVKRTASFDNKGGVADTNVDTPPSTVPYSARTEILQ